MAGRIARGSTILVVDDHPLVTHGLAALLESESWVERVLSTPTAAEALSLGVTEGPEIAVVDLNLPDGDGLELIRKLRRAVPDCAVLVFTMSREEEVIGACLALGVRGYVLKDTTPSGFLHALRAVAEGAQVLGPGVSTNATEQTVRPRLAPPLDRLRSRDLLILALLAEGCSNQQIARTMGVDEKTVRNRLSRILTVCGVADRVQAALLAKDRGLSRAMVTSQF